MISRAVPKPVSSENAQITKTTGSKVSKVCRKNGDGVCDLEGVMPGPAASPLVRSAIPVGIRQYRKLPRGRNAGTFLNMRSRFIGGLGPPRRSFRSVSAQILGGVDSVLVHRRRIRFHPLSNKSSIMKANKNAATSSIAPCEA